MLILRRPQIIVAQILLLIASCTPTLALEVVPGAAVRPMYKLQPLTPKLDTRIAVPLKGSARYSQERGIAFRSTRRLHSRLSHSAARNYALHAGKAVQSPYREAAADEDIYDLKAMTAALEHAAARVDIYDLKATQSQLATTAAPEHAAAATALNSWLDSQPSELLENVEDDLKTELPLQFQQQSRPFDIVKARRCSCGGKGGLLLDEHKWDEAAEFYREKIDNSALSGISANDLNDLAWALAHTDNIEGSIEMATRGLTQEPNASHLLGTRGYAYLRQGKLQEAISDLEKAINIRSGSGEDWYYLGLAYYRAGRLADAKRALKSAAANNYFDTTDNWRLAQN